VTGNRKSKELEKQRTGEAKDWFAFSATSHPSPVTQIAKAASLSAGSPRRPAAIAALTPRLLLTYV